MEIQQLKYIVALARERHFLRASEAVHVTQPTLSHQVKKAEKELGAVLFERSPRNVRLTPAGERFLPFALKTLEALEAGINEVTSLKGQPGGTVTLGVIPTMGPYLLPAVLKALNKEAPRVRLEVHELTTSLLLTQLKSGIIDLGLLSTPIEEAGVQTETFGREAFLLAVPPRHPLAGKKSVTLSEVKKERMLILQEGHCFRDQSLDYCRLSADDPQVVFQGSSLVSVTRLAAAGQGVTFVPEMAAAARDNPGLVFVPFKNPPPGRDLGFVWRKSAPLSLGQRAFMEIVRKIFQTKKD